MALFKASKNRDDHKQRLLTLESRATGFLNLIVVLAVGAVAYTDKVIVEDDSLGYLYLLPIALSALVNRVPVTIALSLLCAFLQELYGPPFRLRSPPRHSHCDQSGGYLMITFFVATIAKQRGRLAAEIRQQRDDYERDLILASQVQQQVLPKPPIVPGLELAAAMQTARLLGGDYYDFFPISDDTVDIVIADVSGKGAAASLLMPSLAVVLRLRARELSGPAAIIKDLDGVLKQITSPSTFVTMFYARFNSTHRTLQYACGGHNPPLIVRTQTNETLLLEESGPIVGILPDAQFSDTVVRLQQGDILTLFTDGVTEQENEREEQFSLDRLRDLILRKEADSAAAIVADVTEAVSSFAGAKEQEDDLTVVVAKVL